MTPVDAKETRFLYTHGIAVEARVSSVQEDCRAAVSIERAGLDQERLLVEKRAVMVDRHRPLGGEVTKACNRVILLAALVAEESADSHRLLARAKGPVARLNVRKVRTQGVRIRICP